MIPRMIPKKLLMSMAATASSMVAGNRSLISLETFSRVQMVSPRSSLTTLLRNSPYWT